ncbi:hypothetical protein D1007_21394 [Hordeum vulgare]|nr:hypothetical protein D1007_21394 [Hordeum vulgare]
MASPTDIDELTVDLPHLSIPEQHLAAEASKEVDYVAMPKASRQWASVLQYLRKGGYNIKLVDRNAFTQAMPHDMLFSGGLGSSIAKSDLTNHDNKEGTHKGSSKVKQRIYDMRERTMGLCSSNWKDPVHDK